MCVCVFFLFFLSGGGGGGGLLEKRGAGSIAGEERSRVNINERILPL